MNERIRQLAEQVVGPSRLHGGDFALMGNKQVEKFAELIVRECMTQIEEVKQIQVRQMPVLEYNQGFDDGMFVAIRTIEEHFGVEE